MRVTFISFFVALMLGCGDDGAGPTDGGLADLTPGTDAGVESPGLRAELLVGAGVEFIFDRIGSWDGERYWSEGNEVVDGPGTLGPWDAPRLALTRPRAGDRGAVESLAFDLQSVRPRHVLSAGTDWLVFTEAPEGPVLEETHSTPALVGWPMDGAPFVVPLPRVEVQSVAPDHEGGIWLAGVAQGSADFGSGPIRSEGGTATFLAHVTGKDAVTGEMLVPASHQVHELVAFGEGRLALRLTVEGEWAIYGTGVDSGPIVAVIDPAADSLLGHWPVPGEPVGLVAMGNDLRFVFEWATGSVSFGDHVYDPIAGADSTFVDVAWDGTEPPLGERWAVSPLTVDARGVTFAPVGAAGGLMAKPLDTTWVFSVMESPLRASAGVWSYQAPNRRHLQHVGSSVFASFDAERDLNVDFESLETPLGGPTQWALRFALDGSISDVLTFPIPGESFEDSYSTALGEGQVLHLAVPEGARTTAPIEVLDWSGTTVAAEQAVAEGDGCELSWLPGNDHDDFRLVASCGSPHQVTVGDVVVSYEWTQSVTWVRFRYVEE